MSDSWAQKLISDLGSKKPSADLVGKGMAAEAANKLGGRAYQIHLQEAEATGEDPMTPEEFSKQRTGQLKRLVEKSE